MSGTRREPISLAAAVYACLLGGVIVLTAAAAFYAPRYLQKISMEHIGEEVTMFTKTIALDLARIVHQDWSEMRFLADHLGSMEDEPARNYLNGVVGDGKRISWAGIAGTDGLVRVASGGLLEGADVSARPWFGAGLRGGFAGDVHDAVLLQTLLGGDDAEPLRFIDLAFPVRDAGGAPIGVLAFQISFDWVTGYLTEAAAARAMDFLLINSAGEVIAGSFVPPENLLSVDAIRSAATGMPASLQETWPDGMSYYSSIVPDVAFADLPSFGWRLLGRLPVNEFSSSDRELALNVLMFGVVACLVFSVAAILFTVVFIRPLSKLTEVAERISRGEHDYPRETRSSREAGRLATALARLQSRFDDDRHAS